MIGMKKVAVVFHSICGNTYLLAKAYADAFKAAGADVDLLRVKDDTYHDISLQFDSSKEYRDEILKVPVVSDGKAMVDYDAVFMGSPTYYGAVSAQMKAFMDSFCTIWVDALMAGKYFGAFATSGTACGGSEFAIQSLNIFAQHVGMITLSVPCNIGGTPQPAYGITYASGDMADQRINDGVKQAVEGYVRYVMTKI